MNSKLYKGLVEHERFSPVSHRLVYNLYVYAMDLSELDDLDRRLPLFGYNRFRPVSLYDGDYLERKPGSIRQKLMDRLSSHVTEAAVGQVIMVTSPRLFGYVFNPVSFYFCFDANGALIATVAEVNNTFGEKHVYVLSSPVSTEENFPVRYTEKKAFHVSPFNSMGGHYEFTVADIRRELDIQIDLHRDGAHILRARLRGSPLPLTPFNHLKTLARHPFLPHLTISRIYREAFKLKFKRKLTYYGKPVPPSPMTIRRLPPTALQRACMRLVVDHLSETKNGRLRLRLPDGKNLLFGEESEAGPAAITVNDYRFFSRSALGADIGLGESFMNDEWDTDDIPAVISFFIRNRDTVQDGNFKESLLIRFLERLRYLTRANTLPGSRKNIHRHYDLSHEFFSTFLDDTMAYSCGLYLRQDDTLKAAQLNKFSAIMEKARLCPEDHVLEIGCGWGGFAIEAARRCGCRVTGITISKDQYRYAVERVRREGLEDRVEILFRDYRHMQGRFDKIVSIEMLEAVGHAYFSKFFRQLDRLLAPNGVAVLQTITIPDQRYDAYRKSHDWIKKHIFPGGLLPSLTVLTRTMTRHSGLMVEHLENIGDHYAVTLAQWRKRFTENRDHVTQLGFDRTFQRKWVYYLASCEAGFRERVLGNLQMVLTREGNRNLVSKSKKRAKTPK